VVGSLIEILIREFGSTSYITRYSGYGGGVISFTGTVVSSRYRRTNY
jgi:hypothetical protein